MFAKIYTLPVATLGKMRGILNVLDGASAAITTGAGVVRAGRNEQGHGNGMIVRHPYVPI